jgi:ATP-dependent DNA ligase
MPLVRFPELFDHPDWLFEFTYDGFRALAHITRRELFIQRRGGYGHPSR